MFFEVNLYKPGQRQTGRITLSSMEVKALNEIRPEPGTGPQGTLGGARAMIETAEGDVWITDDYEKIRDILFGLDV